MKGPLLKPFVVNGQKNISGLFDLLFPSLYRENRICWLLHEDELQTYQQIRPVPELTVGNCKFQK